jgi:hypothetical protein
MFQPAYLFQHPLNVQPFLNYLPSIRLRHYFIIILFEKSEHTVLDKIRQFSKKKKRAVAGSGELIFFSFLGDLGFSTVKKISRGGSGTRSMFPAQSCNF